MGACHARERIIVNSHLGVVGEWIGNERDRRLQHIDLDPPATARALTLVKSAKNAVAGEHPGCIVRYGGSADLRMLRIKKEARDPAEREPHAVIGGPAAIWSRGAKAGNRTVNET